MKNSLSGIVFYCIFMLIIPINGNAQTQPNILWIIGEDLGPELTCYGYPEVRTPNIDRLASLGVTYTRAFTTAPVCSPSRSAFMTGMYQTSIGAHNHRSHRNDGYALPEGVKVITDWLRAGGYFTANIVHLTDDENEKYFRGTGKTDWNFQYDGEPFDTDKWADLSANQPFYAQINFPETHRGGAWDNAHKHIPHQADPDKVIMPPYYPNHPEARADWAQYLNAVMSLDMKVGYVLKKLENDGLADNTIVIFMGDHGRAMVRGKQWPYESGLRIPLVIRWPDILDPPEDWRAGSMDDRLIESIDISATTLALAGIKPPIIMQGRVFLGPEPDPARKYAFGGRDRGDETVDRIRTVRDHRYRYILNFYPERPFLQTNRYKEFTYPMIALMRELYEEGKLDPVQAQLLAPTRPPEELYDLENDPNEINNLAEDPAFKDKLLELRTALETWMTETNDQGRFPESPEIIEFWNQRAINNYDERIEKMLEERKKNRQ